MAFILCGFLCAGKSTLGRMCAEKARLPFYDTDRILEENFGKNTSVAAILKEIGMEKFRTLESEVILSLQRKPSFIATGGGSLLLKTNRLHLVKIGISIYLRASVPQLYNRISTRGFPSYLDQSRPYEHFKEIAHERFSIYENHCDYKIDTDGAQKEEIAEQIFQLIQ